MIFFSWSIVSSGVALSLYIIFGVLFLSVVMAYLLTSIKVKRFCRVQ